MREYLISITALALVGAIVISMIPFGGSARYLKLLCALCTIGCIVFPLSSFVSAEINKDDLVELMTAESIDKEYYDEIYNKSINDQQIKSAEYILKNDIIKRFSADALDFDVNVILEEKSDEILISLVRITIYPEGVTLNIRAIEKYVFEKLGCDCEFEYALNDR